MSVMWCPRRREGAFTDGPDEWRDEGGVRTCSFCGGLHPVDFLGLVRDGVEVGPTDKAYKFYVDEARVRGAGKFYTQHFEHGGGSEFRALVADGKVNWGYPGYPYVALYVPETGGHP